MNHLEIGRLESEALEPTPWDTYVARCVKLCSRHLRKDHERNPSFDGDDSADGYSLDWLYDQYKAGKRPLDVLHSLVWRAPINPLPV